MLQGCSHDWRLISCSFWFWLWTTPDDAFFFFVWGGVPPAPAQCFKISNCVSPQWSRPIITWPTSSQRAPCSFALASSWVSSSGLQTHSTSSNWPRPYSSSTCFHKSSWTPAISCQTNCSSETLEPFWSTPSSGPCGILSVWGSPCGAVRREEPWVRGC